MQRWVKDRIKRSWFIAYKAGTRVGVHMLPVHYYSAEPNIVELERTKAVWAKASSLPGIRVDVDAQMARLRKTCEPFIPECRGNGAYIDAKERHYGPGFGYVEAKVLHGVIRSFKPGKIIEVGSGVSTYCSFAALSDNYTRQGIEWEITCVEPNPSDRLRALAERENRLSLLEQPVQAVSVDLFHTLSAGDILFIDSSHVVKAGSDVNYLILEVLPRLKQGVLVHFHDIYFPYDYQRDLLHTFLHNNENSLLRAFLTFNEKFEILFCLSQLHYERQAELQQLFPDYRPQPGRDGLRDIDYDPELHFPSSIWLRVLA